MTNSIEAPGEREAIVASGGDILSSSFDQIRLAYDSLKRDRDRLKDVITTLRVNALRGSDTDKLLEFMRDGLGGVGAGLTIGEMIIAFQQGDHIGEQHD